MLSVHINYDQNKNVIRNTQSLTEETLYEAFKKKKAKLSKQIITEKMIYPELSAEADQIVSDIEKAKTYSAKIGRIRFFYSWSKGTYFYIHKIIDDKDSYVDSVRFYSSLPASDLMNSLLQTDGL